MGTLKSFGFSLLMVVGPFQAVAQHAKKFEPPTAEKAAAVMNKSLPDMIARLKKTTMKTSDFVEIRKALSEIGIEAADADYITETVRDQMRMSKSLKKAEAQNQANTVAPTIPEGLSIKHTDLNVRLNSLKQKYTEPLQKAVFEQLHLNFPDL